MKLLHYLRKGRLCGGFRSLLAISFVKSVNATRSVDELLFASEERVASGANFHMQVTLPSGTGLKSFAAGANDVDLSVFGVNSRFHYFFSRSLL